MDHSPARTRAHRGNSGQPNADRTTIPEPRSRDKQAGAKRSRKIKIASLR
jgi:hypothetical protein